MCLPLNPNSIVHSPQKKKKKKKPTLLNNFFVAYLAFAT